MDWNDFTSGGIGALIGSVLMVAGFRGRLNILEKEAIARQKECDALWAQCKEIRQECKELRDETLAVNREIRNDIKELIKKTAQRRED